MMTVGHNEINQVCGGPYPGPSADPWWDNEEGLALEKTTPITGDPTRI